jgi:hypothetical protein
MISSVKLCALSASCEFHEVPSQLRWLLEASARGPQAQLAIWTTELKYDFSSAEIIGIQGIDCEQATQPQSPLVHRPKPL